MCYEELTTDIRDLSDICKKLEKRSDILGIVTQKKINEDGTIEYKTLWIPISKYLGRIFVEVSRKNLKKTERSLRRIKGIIDKPKRIDQIHVSFLGEKDSIDIQFGHR